MVEPDGQIGEYLHTYRYNRPWFQQGDKGFFDLGDIAALVDPDLSYNFKGSRGSILRCYHIDRDESFELLYDRLKSEYGK